MKIQTGFTLTFKSKKNSALTKSFFIEATTELLAMQISTTNSEIKKIKNKGYTLIRIVKTQKELQ